MRSAFLSSNGFVTQAADELRTGWYPDQPGLDPTTVAGKSFGRRVVSGQALPGGTADQVFAQPLVNGSNVFIATEGNNLYVLDGETLAIKSSRFLGAPFKASDVNCTDLTPTVGVTGTPVIDPATNTAYLLSKTYDATPYPIWYFHAVDATTLAERPGFPVVVKGNADNDASVAFDPTWEMQRPGLLLMNGVAYAAFGAHCDFGTYHGWVFGFDVNTGAITARFATEVGPTKVRGAGIWQSGGGLVSDGPGRIFFITGNGYGPAPTAAIAGSTPPALLDEAFVRLQVQGNGQLTPADFFMAYDVATLNNNDTDFGAGAPVGLPQAYFGTSSFPKLAIAAGKKGELYVVNRDNLGGFTPNTDAVVSTTNLAGGLWSRPSVWPGDGGNVYAVPNGQKMQALRYGVSGSGVPKFSVVGATADTFGYTSGSPVVTSNGTSSGSAVVWVTHTTGPYGTGELRAYGAVPDGSGTLPLLYADAIGTHSKFTTPGVGSGRIYVGTSDGRVFSYGAPTTAPVTAPVTSFGTIVVGSSSTLNVVFTANTATTVTGLTATDPTFRIGTTVPALPATLAVGATMTVPVTFGPTAATSYVAALNVTSSAGAATATLRGTGQPNAPVLSISAIPAFTGVGGGPVVTGTSTSQNVTLSNTGAQALTFTGFALPSAPFSLSGLPSVNQALAPGASITAAATFAPAVNGSFTDKLVVQSNGGNVTVNLTGAAGSAPVMALSPLTLSYGDIPAGSSATLSFTVSNQGGSGLAITKSKAPTLGAFTVPSNTLPEGAVIAAGQSLTESVVFTPTASGTFTDQWVITGNDGSGVQAVTFNGTSGLATALPRTGWTATASSSNGGEPPSNALDGSATTRWSTGAAQTNGQYFQLNLGARKTFSQVRLDAGTSTGDFPAGYQVFVSNDGTTWGGAVASGAPTTQVVTIAFAAQSAQYIKIVQTAAKANWWSIHEINVYGVPCAPQCSGKTCGPDACGGSCGSCGAGTGCSSAGQCVAGGTCQVALLTPVGATASSSETNNGVVLAATYAIDGNGATRWGSLFSDPQWISVDFGAPVHFDHVELDWEAAYSTSYQVQVSNDNATFTTVLSNAAGKGGNETISGLNAVGRYLRVYSLARATPYGVSLYEIKTWGDTSSTCSASCAPSCAGKSCGSDGCGGSCGTCVAGSVCDATGQCAASATCQVALLTPSTAAASSFETYNGTPLVATNAIDGNAATRWSSLFSDPQWITVDYGAPRHFDHVELDWEAAYSTKYQLQVSNDNATFAPILTNAGGKGGVEIASSLNASGRYLRLYSTARATPYGVSLYEIKAWGDVNANCR